MTDEVPVRAEIKRYTIDGEWNVIDVRCSNGIEVGMSFKRRREWVDEVIVEAAAALCWALGKAFGNFAMNLRLATWADKIVFHVQARRALEFEPLETKSNEANADPLGQ